MNTIITGIHQSDLIIKSGMEAALADLRVNAWLLNYCFQSLAQDELTNQSYGQKAIDAARRWFLKTEIPVVIAPTLNGIEGTCVSITLMKGDDAETTLADIHYQPTEDTDMDERPALAGPFTPTSYDPATGHMVVPTTVSNNLIIVPGMALFDNAGNEYPIVEVLDDSTFVTTTGVASDFSQATIKGALAGYVTSIESVNERETYLLGCHAQGEPVHCVYLHSIVKFCLLLYKQKFLEKRGLERTSFNSTDMKLDPSWGVENLISRYISLTGYVRQVWPKEIKPKITGVVMQTRVAGGGVMALSPSDLRDAPWLGDQDPLDVTFGGGATSPYSNPAAPRGAPVVYWGNSKEPGYYDDVFIQALASQAPAQTRALYLPFWVADGEYAFVAWPATFGGSPQGFKNADANRPVTFTKVAYDIEIVDPATGVTRSYDVWRSNEPALGDLTIQAS